MPEGAAFATRWKALDELSLHHLSRAPPSAEMLPHRSTSSARRAICIAIGCGAPTPRCAVNPSRRAGPSAVDRGAHNCALKPCRAVRRRPRRLPLRPHAVLSRPPSAAAPTPHLLLIVARSPPPRLLLPPLWPWLPLLPLLPRHHRHRVASHRRAMSPPPSPPPPPGLLPTRRPAFSREERENVRGGEREKGWCGILTCGIHVGPTLRDKVSYISHSHPRSHFIVECHAIISYGCVRLQGLQQRCSLYEQ